MLRVLAAGTATTLFVLALIVLLAGTSGGERLASALAVGGLAFLSGAFLAHVNDHPRA
jgi:hypothetical protein